MSLLAPRFHRLLDFVTVVLFAAAPPVLGLSGSPAILSYGLAAVHLLVTVSTAFPGQPRRPLSFPAHGGLEAAVGIALVALPWTVGWTGTVRTFYTVMGAVILIVWLLSRYRA